VAGSGDGWPGRLLAGYARLHLLARAHEHLDELPAGLAASVRAHVGYPVTRQEVLAGPGVRDLWLVLTTRDVLDAPVPLRRIVLRGQQTARLAVLLVFDPRGVFSGDQDAGLAPGTALDAELHFYPGEPALRAVIGARHTGPGPAAAPDPGSEGRVGRLLDDWAAALGADPWLAWWPALVVGTPVPGGSGSAGAGWVLTDGSGQAVPLRLAGADPWVLVAVAGGRPVTVTGEWDGESLRPLTAWHGHQAVRL
jgi:hypothetical protein